MFTDGTDPGSFWFRSADPPDVRQEGEGQEEARQEATDMGEVVDPRQQTEGEEEDGDGGKLGERSPRPLQDLPALEKLHEEAGQDAELAAGGTHLERKQEEETGSRFLCRVG